MIVTTEVPQTATRITGFDFGLIARNQVILRSSRPAEYRSSSKCAFVRFILFDETIGALQVENVLGRVGYGGVG
jgi:hypothetical protein